MVEFNILSIISGPKTCWVKENYYSYVESLVKVEKENIFAFWASSINLKILNYLRRRSNFRVCKEKNGLDK